MGWQTEVSERRQALDKARQAKKAQGGNIPEYKLGSGMWLNQSVNKLIRAGHRLADIRDYSISQFLMFLDAVNQLHAEDRISFVADMTAVVGSLFSKDSPIQEHMNLLTETTVGVKRRGNSSK